MKLTQLFEAPILGRGMSKAARVADVEQSDREYIAQRQQRQKLSVIANELKQSSTIESAKLSRDGIEVQTSNGDLVTFNMSTGKLFAWVQGQKNDIDCGDIGSTADDVLSFLSGIDLDWYREHDEHFED
jgi:hypothetical protein